MFSLTAELAFEACLVSYYAPIEGAPQALKL